MTRKRPDYTEARNYYIKGYKNEYPTLQDIATELAKLRTDAGVDLDSQELVFLVE